MTELNSGPGQDFDEFLQAMDGLRLLHLGHKDADCDALASAYAMSCVLPGDVGFAKGLKTSAQDLAEWLEFSPLSTRIPRPTTLPSYTTPIPRLFWAWPYPRLMLCSITTCREATATAIFTIN